MTNLQLHIQKAKRLGVNLTVLATSISLAACGGGGSEGFYGNGTSGIGNNAGTGNDTQVKEVAGITLALSKNELNVKGDTITLTAKAVDKDGGGVAGKKISLNIKDAIINGATADSSEVTTDEKGNATFTVTLNGSNSNLSELLFTVTVAGTTINDVKKAAVTGAGTVTQSQYELRFDTAASLKVIGGETNVRVRAVDANGGGVPNEKVALKVKDFQKNGVMIKGLSTTTTDNQGYAEFTLELPAGKEADRAALIAEGVGLEAVLTEANGATKTQVYTLGVSSVSNVVSNLILVTGNNNKVDAVDGLINVIVTAKNPEGIVVVNKDIQLTLDEQAVKYGAKLVNTVVKTNSKGEAVFTIQTGTNQDNPDGKMLVSNGITVQALLKENAAIATQSTKITVVAPVAEDVTSLSLATANDINISGGEAVIAVTAKDKNGGALVGKAINLSIPQIAGLSIKNGSKIITDSNGQAKFTVSFNSSNVPKATTDELLSKGIMITAQYTGLSNQAITQTTKLGFYQVNVEKEVQRIELTATKGIVTSTGDSVQVVARALDNEGKPAINKAISLGLTDEVQQNGVSFDGAVTKNTDQNGYVTFTIRTNALNEQAIEKLVSSGIAVAVSTKLTDGNSVTQNTTIMVAASALSTAEVAYLDIVEPASLDISKANKNMAVAVRAYKSNGATAANKDIRLSLDKSYSAISIDNSAPTTNSSGQATFILKYDPTQLSASERNELLQSGLSVTARFGSVTQKTKVSFYSLEANIQRMDLVVDKPALVASVGSAQTVKATVTLKDANSAAIRNRQIIIAVDPVALQQGVSFTGGTGGSIAVTTDANGQATVEFTVNAKDQAMLDALLSSGIGIGASAVQGDGSGTISQSTKINVLSEAAENEVGYLTAESSDVVATTGGTSTISVKAFNSKGVAAAGKTVKLNLGAIPNGLNIKLDNASQVTDAAGNAAFKVTYTAATSLSAEQIKALLAGISATASYTNSAGKTITQSIIIQFSADAAIAQDAQRLELNTSKGVIDAGNDSFTFTAKVFDKDGNPLIGKYVGLGLDAAAAQNGVTFVGAQQIATDANGLANFTINVRGASQQMIDNLVANGIGLTASVVQSNGTEIKQTTQVMAKAPQTLAVSKLDVNSSSASIESTGGSTVIAVRAVDIAGNPVVNRDISFALGGVNATNARVSVDKNSAPTNSQGYAYFTVNIANGEVDNDLVKDGLTYAVNTINQNDGNSINQVGKINVSVPAGTYNLLPLTPSKPSLLITGDTVTVTSKLVDNNGAPLKSQPVTLMVNNVAVNGGVNVEGGMTAITDVNGNVSFKLTLPAKTDQVQINELLTNGLTIKTSVTLPNGNKRFSDDLKLAVEEAVSVYHFDISPSKTTLNVEGDETLVAVSLLDRNNQPVKNRKITLTARNTAGTVIVTSNGSVIETQPQTVTTDELGRGFYKVRIPSSGFDQDLLVASGILLDASNIDDNGVVTTQISRINVVSNTGGNNQLPSRYSLRLSSAKPTLNVRDDISDVTVTVIDSNGGGVAGKYVTLAISDFVRNGAIIVGPSGLTTDENGRATFRVKVDETARNQNYTATQFAFDDLILTARLSEEGYTAISQDSKVNVVQSVVQQPVASIVIGVNPTEVGTSSDGVYYTRNMSASVVDFDGRPLSKQEVALDITPLSYVKGAYSWDLVTDALGNQSEKWVYHDTVTCAASAAGTAITNTQVTNIPVKVPTFLGSQGTTATYTTDADGKFDFTIRYPKIYSQWLNVRIGAASTVTTLPTRTVYDLGLPPLANDYSTDGTYGPNLISPYGTNFTCP